MSAVDTGGGRTANLLGAVVLGLHDELAAALKEATGRGGALAAALTTTAQFDGLTVGALRRFLGISRPATVRLVNVLESDGLARRIVEDDDRRSTSVRLTPAGREEARRILDVRAAVIDRLLADADEDEQALLDRTLEALLTRMTTHPSRGYELCRLCDLQSCPQDRCPVERAVVALDPAEAVVEGTPSDGR